MLSFRAKRGISLRPEPKKREIPRFARNDNIFSFFGDVPKRHLKKESLHAAAGEKFGAGNSRSRREGLSERVLRRDARNGWRRRGAGSPRIVSADQPARRFPPQPLFDYARGFSRGRTRCDRAWTRPPGVVSFSSGPSCKAE